MSRLSIAFCVALALLVGAMWWSHVNTERLIAAEGERRAERSEAVRESARHVERMLMWTRGAALGVLLLVFLGLRGEIRRRQAAETAMGAAEERLRLAIEGADLGILHWDLRTGAITWSERGLEFFGLEETGPLQREKFLPLIHPDDVPRVDGARARVLAGNPEYDVEFRICRPDGSIRWLAVSGRAVADAEGRPAVIQGVGRDVTARRQAEDDVRALAAQVATSNAELLAANRELEAFSYSVSHDLRAPLRSIDGFGLALAEDAGPRLNDEERGHVQRIRAATQRMSRLIDDLLELSRVGRSELRREDVDLSSTAAAIVAELRASDPTRNVEVAIEENVRALADSHLVRMVLTNLIGNAWKYTSKTAAGRIRFEAEGPPERRTYVVRDNGVGFDMAYAQKLFGVFQRLHSAAEFPGTGVGLAIVRRIVHRHGGEVTGEGRPGEGATFRFTLGPTTAPGAGGT